ncbi:MAG: PAS domain S-box protein [Acidobacteriota bacterium]
MSSRDDLEQNTEVSRGAESPHDVLERRLHAATEESIGLEERLARAEEDRATAEHLLRMLDQALDALGDGLVIINVAAAPTIAFVNRRFSEMTGYRAEEIVGAEPFVFAGPETPIEVLSQMEAALTARERFRGETLFYRGDGSQIRLAVEIEPLDVTTMVAFYRDLSAYARTVHELERAETRHRLLIERMNEGFVTTDGSNRFELVNPKMAQMLGYPREDLVGKPIESFLDPEEQVKVARQQELRRLGHDDSYELTWIASDGRQVETVVSPTPVLASNGRFLGSFAVVADITERKQEEEESRRLEARIQRAQREELMEHLAGGVAHDFNNLLVGILGNAGLALMQLEDGSPVRELIARIETAAVRAAELTREMLAYSGHGRFVIEPHDLSELVTEMAQLLRTTISRRATLDLRCAADVPPVKIDATQVRQVVMNLIVNAAEAIEESGRSGTVTVATGLARLDRESLDLALGGDELDTGVYVFLEVRDNGIGMDAATRDQIFNPFFSRKFHGRGLGLAAVQGIVRGHRGAIRVDSRPGSGTSFVVYLPPSEELPVESPVVPRPSHRRGTGTVLVVDDEPAVLGVAEAALASAGYNVLVSGDGHTAIELFERYRDDVRVVVLDMTMPGMTGPETLTALRAIESTLPVVLISGYSEQDAIDRYQDDVPDAFLQKPFRPDQLIRTVQEVEGS